MIEVGRVLYGSDNYQLNGPDSDKDYKVLLMPTFTELYRCKRAEKSDLNGLDPDHFSVMDVRQFNSLLKKCNSNVMEMLYSVEWTSKDAELDDYRRAARLLFLDGYVALHWKEFYAATTGLVLNSLKRYGYDNPKSASRAYYFAGLVKWIVESDFRVSDYTWRDNAYSSLANKVRFEKADQASDYANIAADFFENNKDYYAKEAAAWCKENYAKCQAFEARAELLTMQMQNYVKSYLMKELS